MWAVMGAQSDGVKDRSLLENAVLEYELYRITPFPGVETRRQSQGRSDLVSGETRMVKRIRV